MALNIFNLSADTADADPSKPEDLSVNDMETVLEVFAEQVFGYVNTFEESDEKDEPSGQSLDINKVSFFAHKFETKRLAAMQSTFSKPCFKYIIPQFPMRYSEVLNPPPEA
jgi:hypothetical protein